jgi:hypothetical protein
MIGMRHGKGIGGRCEGAEEGREFEARESDRKSAHVFCLSVGYEEGAFDAFGGLDCRGRAAAELRGYDGDRQRQFRPRGDRREDSA